MNAVFADTFYWIAFTNIQDLAHEKAKALTRSALPQEHHHNSGSAD
jgi:predicted nucleic acid-binding protein